MRSALCFFRLDLCLIDNRGGKRKCAQRLILKARAEDHARVLIRALAQVWDGGSLVNTVSGNGEMHGTMYTGDVFSSLEWDAGDERLIYVAERKAKEASSFWQSVRKQGKWESLLRLLRGRSRRRPLCGDIYGDMG